ncbi:MAG: hypothetical protein M3Y30_13680 [Gemmatimonadota bacterium]|nr:hypothetical protein [Gemmatimonadota bacterium]
MRPTALRLAVTLGALLVACTGHESSSSGESAASVSGPNAPAGAGRGHVQLTGDATVDTDFAVDQCTIGPAGEGLLDGYRMNAKAARGTLQLLSIAVKSYEGDGTFTPPVDTGKSSIVGKHGVSGPLSMTIGRENSTVPLPVITKPESKLTITISDSGSRGTADFSELTSPVAMEDVDIKAPLHAKRKSFAGSITWRCASVERLDAATTNAAKSMTKGLTPIH